jgi:endoglucanase
MRRYLAAFLGCVTGCGAPSALSPSSPGSPPHDGGAPGGDAGGAFAGLHVVGNRLFYQGKATRLLGVDHAGSEYTCVQGNGIFEGPDADRLATAILTWGHANAVRLPLNEDCWLGLNGVLPQYSGARYADAVVSYAARLHAHGLFTIVDLHWSAPGSFPATSQQPMADADHSVAFWSSVANAFAGDAMTVFDLYNEPFVSASNAQTTDPWTCWKSGCTVTSSLGSVTGAWQTAGMQGLVDAVRATGATNVLMLGGLSYADDLTGWLANLPVDPLGQLAASFHLYNFSSCVTVSCWDAVIAPIAKQHPVITGELGENDCAHGFIDGYMPWADANGVSYLGWAWNQWDCGRGPALISDYGGASTRFGEGLEAHLRVTSP